MTQPCGLECSSGMSTLAPAARLRGFEICSLLVWFARRAVPGSRSVHCVAPAAAEGSRCPLASSPIRMRPRSGRSEGCLHQPCMLCREMLTVSVMPGFPLLPSSNAIWARMQAGRARTADLHAVLRCVTGTVHALQLPAAAPMILHLLTTASWTLGGHPDVLALSREALLRRCEWVVRRVEPLLPPAEAPVTDEEESEEQAATRRVREELRACGLDVDEMPVNVSALVAFFRYALPLPYMHEQRVMSSAAWPSGSPLHARAASPVAGTAPSPAAPTARYSLQPLAGRVLHVPWPTYRYPAQILTTPEVFAAWVHSSLGCKAFRAVFHVGCLLWCRCRWCLSRGRASQAKHV